MTDLPQLDGPRFGPASGGPSKQLVVFLHGLGADGNDLISLGPVLAQHLPDAAFVSPDAPEPCDMAPMGRQWFSLQQYDPVNLLAGARRAMPVLNAFIDAELARLGLGDADLALVGFSQGTMTGLFTALRRPQPCAAVVGFSGALIGAEVMAGEIQSRPPVLLVHGEADQVVPFQAMAAAAQVLAAFDVPVRSQGRPGLGHGIDEMGLGLALAHLKEGFGLNDPAGNAG